MPDKTQKEQIQELCQAVIGIPENPDDNGLIGDVRDLVTYVKEQNKRIGKNERRISKVWGILIGVGAVGGTGLGFGLSNFLGG